MLRDNLKRLREEADLTQDELAQRLHVVRQTVSKWERGASVPDADMLARIAALYGVSASSLLDEQPIADAELEYIATQTALLNERLDHQEERRREIVRYLCIGRRAGRHRVRLPHDTRNTRTKLRPLRANHL